ncbi:MAG: hypothetical protein OXM61_07190 [Candidatus Poribacteria bacterium]|nr:hypothetical protein [Candidatus Poribacteria bacterium]
MQHPSEWEPLEKWLPLSKSYAFGLEGGSPNKFLKYFTFGTQIEYERDTSIVIDPHVHVDIFTQFPPYSKWKFLKCGVGIWGAGQQLSTNSAQFRSGWHFHIDIRSGECNLWHFNMKYFNMMIESIPRWNFGEFRVIGSPEMVIKFKDFGDKFAFVIHGEIEYYHNKTGLTFEPIVDINPWKMRWTQLIRVSY